MNKKIDFHKDILPKKMDVFKSLKNIELDLIFKLFPEGEQVCNISVSFESIEKELSPVFKWFISKEEVNKSFAPNLIMSEKVKKLVVTELEDSYCISIEFNNIYDSYSCTFEFLRKSSIPTIKDGIYNTEFNINFIPAEQVSKLNLSICIPNIKNLKIVSELIFKELEQNSWYVHKSAFTNYIPKIKEKIILNY
jgi:hypothetical protein